MEECNAAIQSIQKRFTDLQKKKTSLEANSTSPTTQKSSIPTAKNLEVLPSQIADNNRIEELNQATLQLTHSVQVTTGEQIDVTLLEKIPLSMSTDSNPEQLLTEMELTTEDSSKTIASIEQAINIVEAAFQKQVSNQKRALHTRSGFSSELSGFITLLARAQDLDAQMFQMMDINLARGVQQGNSLNQYAVIIRDNSQAYLVDLSFGQFFKTQTDQKHAGEEHQNNPIMDGVHPVVQQLITKGYVKATPGILREYFNLAVPTAARTADFDKELLDRMTPVKPVHAVRFYITIVEDLIPKEKKVEILKWVFEGESGA